MLIKWEKYRYLGWVKRHRKNFPSFRELFFRSKRNDFDDTQVEIANLVNNGHPNIHIYHNNFIILGDKTENLIGISETLVSTSAAGIIFALLSGQPLIIIGTTGPLLLFDESLYSVRTININNNAILIEKLII